MRWTISVLLVAIVTLLMSCGSDEETTTTAVAASCQESESLGIIDEEDLLESVSRLAGDEMEGRAPGSRGDALARGYLAQRLEEMGYEPAFQNNSWEQPVAMLGVTSNLPETWRFEAGDGESVAFGFREEYMGGAGAALPELAFEDAEVVFVGYGIQAAEEGWDDYKGTDLQGKVLLMLNDDPHWDPELFAGERKLYYGRWWYKYEIAAEQGAAAAIIVHTADSAGYPWIVVRNSWNGEQFRLAEDKAPKVLLESWLTEEASRRLVALAGHDLDDLRTRARSRDFSPLPLGVTTSLAFTAEIRETESANVAGILTGSDEALAEQVLIYSAHHDHLGIGEPDETGDAIYNGALDNGVAMAQALEVAQALSSLSPRPRRSVMFLFVAAEEQGLLGSRYFAQSNRLDPGLIAANINFELGNVWGPTRDITIYGMGKSTLEDSLAELAAQKGRTVAPETDPRAGWYYRSDQFSFARIGVPSIWFKSGTDFIDKPAGWGEETYAAWIRESYHRPSDEVSPDWNLQGLAEDARLAFCLGLEVANDDNLPTWYPGDEFEDERHEALRAVGAEME